MKNLIRFEVLDTYGTSQRCWTLREAYAWLAVCAPQAVILNHWSGKVVAVRVVELFE